MYTDEKGIVFYILQFKSHKWIIISLMHSSSKESGDREENVKMEYKIL